MDLLETTVGVDTTDNASVISDDEVKIKEKCNPPEVEEIKDCQSKVKCLYPLKSDNTFSQNISNNLLVSHNPVENNGNILSGVKDRTQKNPFLLPGVSNLPVHGVGENSHVSEEIIGIPSQIFSKKSKNLSVKKKGIKVKNVSTLINHSKIEDSEASQIKVDRVMTLPVQHFVKMSNPNLSKSKTNFKSDIPTKKMKSSNNTEGLDLLWLQQNSDKGRQHLNSKNVNKKTVSDSEEELFSDNKKNSKTEKQMPSIRIRSSMGQSVFTDDAGFYYREDVIIGSERFLKCVHTEKCQALAKMGLEEEAPIAHLGPAHRHKPFLVSSHRNSNELYEQLKLNSRTDFFDASNSANTSVSEDEKETLINSDTSLKYNVKSKKGSNIQKIPALPKTLIEFSKLLDSNRGKQTYGWTLMDTPVEFYNGTVTNNAGQIQAVLFMDRTILATLEDNLKSEIKDFVMDTTFRVLPSSTLGLKHLFSLHAIVRNSSLPLMYAIMTSTEKEVYAGILKEFQKVVPEWPVKTVLMERHRPLLDAVAEVFPGTRCYGCWYHYCYSIWKAVMKEGLVEECKRFEQCLLVVRMLMVLPHLPPSSSGTKPALTIYDSVRSVREYVREHNLPSALNKVIEHVEDVWLAKFKPENFTLFGFPGRAPMFIESFHLQLLAFMKPKGHIWSLTHDMRRVAKDVSNDLDKLIVGKPTLRKIRSQRFNVLIRESYRHLVSGSYTMEMFLKRISISVEDMMDIFLHCLQPVIKADEEDESFEGWDMTAVLD